MNVPSITAAPRASARRLPTWVRRAVPPTLAAVALAGALEVICRAGVFSPETVPAPTKIVRTLIDLVGTSVFWDSLLSTVEGWGLGLALATAGGIVAGVLLGTSRVAYRSVQVVIELLRPVPGIAILPLVILVFGIGFKSKVYLVAYAALWPILVQTIYGVQDVDPVARDMARSYGLTTRAQLARIVFPSATPYIATGVRVAASIALSVCVGVELIVGGAKGIGSAISQAQQFAIIPKLYAYVTATALLGLVVNLAFRALEGRVLRWHSSQREAVPQ